MVKKVIDSRIRTLIDNCVKKHERSLFVIVGDNGKFQLPNLHLLLSNLSEGKMNKRILWAYKSKLVGMTSHRKKREDKIKRDIKQGKRDPNSQSPFELFLGLQDIRYVYYKETEAILGNTYGMCILQDFDAMTPNILARTIETVEGGGMIVLMLKSMTSLKQLYTMTMDVHSRYRTEAHGDVVARFNERFLLSLGTCASCLVVDDELNVLPVSGAKTVKPFVLDEDTLTARDQAQKKLQSIKDMLEGVQPAQALVNVTKTGDQARAVMTFIDAVAEKTLRNTVALTAGRGRGKSAAMGLAIAAAIAHGYSNIFITSPSPENLKTLFEFIFKGFDALNYSEHTDYDIIQSTNPAFNHAVVRVNVFHSHRQTIQYIVPGDSHVLGQAELVVIDEAAAIPLPLVRKLLGPYLVFMASTINGYEGTGRSLSLKLIKDLRQKSSSSSSSSLQSRVLKETSLDEPIRYTSGDSVENWLNKLLCLSASTKTHSGIGAPHPNDCNLFYLNRDTLFSFHPVSEAFLHKVMGLYVASHYKNSPNDLQLLSDAPAHQLFVLLPPVDDSSSALPEPICVVQLALEGQISKQSILQSLAAGKRGGGDLIPWVVSQQFQDEEFASLSGARVVRIATNPDFVSKGYGSRALQLLVDYFEGKFTDLSESVKTDKDFEVSRLSDEDLAQASLTEDIHIRDPKTMPPLFLGLSERRPERLDYIGVSYGLTGELHKFWKRAKFTPVYLRQTPNELTGEHTCVMLRTLANTGDAWLSAFARDFHRRFLQLLAFEFRSFSATQALSILEATGVSASTDQTLTKKELDRHLTPFDLKRLESYANNRLDYHVIVDLLPVISMLQLGGSQAVGLSGLQNAILLGAGLQKKDMETLAGELKLSVNQCMAIFAKMCVKVSGVFRQVVAKEYEADRLNSKAKKLEQQVPEINGDTVEEMDEGSDVNEDNSINEEMNEEKAEENDEDEEDEELDPAAKERQERAKALIDSFAARHLSKETEWDEVALSKAVKGSGSVAVKTKKDKRKGVSAEEVYAQESKKVKKPRKERR